MKAHFRDYPFRPPRRVYDTQAGALTLFGRFLRAYVWPYRRAVALCTTLVCMEACSVYVLAWLTQVVVDDVLVVTPATLAVPAAGRLQPDDGPPHVRENPAGRERPAIGLGQRINRPNVNQMAVSGLARLIQANATGLGDGSCSHGNMESFVQVVAQFLRERFGVNRQDINGLRHSRITGIRIHSLRPEDNCIVAALHKLQHRGLKIGQRQRFTHCKLLECQNARAEHCKSPCRQDDQNRAAPMLRFSRQFDLSNRSAL